MTNVLLISLDTTRADHLGCYGYRRNTSPHLDRLASQGMLFERCVSPHIPTHPAHTTMLTGCDAFRHQVVANGAKVEPAAGVRMLAEILKERGYWTGAADNLGRWFARGYDRYEGYQWARDSSGAWRKGEAVNKTALSVLNEAASQEKPWFVFAHYWDPHTPYLPPPPFDRCFYHGNERDPSNRSMDEALSFPPFEAYFRTWLDGVTDIEFPKAQYDAEIAYMDTCLAHLFNRVDELGLAEDTLIVVTADHGEELDEHRMWFDHHGLYQTNLHVPLIMRQPGTIPANTYIPELVTMTDLTPTILGHLGLGDEAASLDGRILGFAKCKVQASEPPGNTQHLTPNTSSTQFPIDRTKRPWEPATRHWSDAWDDPPIPDPFADDPLVYLTECTWMRKRGILAGKWKLIVAREHPDIHGCPPIELYDISTDPGEVANVAAAMPEVVDRLRTRMDECIAKRERETGLTDPLETTEIALRRIGPPPSAPVGASV